MKQDKIYNFDFSWELQETVCDNRLDEQDYIGALQAAKYSRSPDRAKPNKKTAQVYFEMQLYDLAAHYYFKYLDLCDIEDRHVAYEGLGLCYLNSGEVTLAQYYLNMSALSSEDIMDIDSDVLEYVRDLAEKERVNFKLVHPPELADYTELLGQSKTLLRDRKYDEAAELLQQVPPESAYFSDAANDMAIAYLLKEDYEMAETCARAVLRKDPHDITALSSLQSVYLQTERIAAAKAIAERLYRIDTDDIEDLYKTASVFCEQNMPYKALDKYRIIEKQAPFDRDILFTLAALHYNTGDLYAAVKYLRNIIDIYDDAVAKYYLKITNKNLFERKDVSTLEPFPYIVRLPVEEKKKILSELSDIASLKKNEAEKFRINSHTRDVFNWCLTNDEITDTVLEMMTVNAISTALLKNIDYVKDLLLNPQIKDSVKFELIGRLCEKNYGGQTGIVMSGIYRKLAFYPVSLQKTARGDFLRAYALCFSKFALIKESYGEKLSRTAETVYYILEVNSSLKGNTYKTLGALIYLVSGIKEAGRSVKKVAHLFDADYAALKNLMTYFKD